jgi:flagellar motor component MotA
MYYLIGLAAFVFSFILVPFTLKGVQIIYLSNPAVILTILFVVVSTLLSTGKFKLFTRGLNAVISRKYYMPDDERRQAADLFRLLSKATIAAAVFLIPLGVMAALGNLSDTEALGHAMVAMLIAPLVGAFVPIAVFEPAAFILLHPSEPSKRGGVKTYPKALGDKLLELCYQNGLSAEDIENATGIELRLETRIDGDGDSNGEARDV